MGTDDVVQVWPGAVDVGANGCVFPNFGLSNYLIITAFALWGAAACCWGLDIKVPFASSYRQTELNHLSSASSRRYNFSEF
jgi:hypothetical protein